jgi:predicted SnoaL-like aldol condensation-catalyzing enzyme
MQPQDVVTKYEKALGSGDWAAARSYLKDDLKFRGPIAQHDKAEAYLEDLKRLHSIIKSIEVKKVFVDGNDVCLLYDMVTNTPAGTAFICEWHHVVNDKIGSIRVVFDATPFAPLFAER